MKFRRTRTRDARVQAARRLSVLAERFERADPPAAQSADPQPLKADEEPLSGGDRVRHGRPGRHAAAAARSSATMPRLTSQHLAVIAMVVATACVLAGWQVLRSVPSAAPVELSSSRIEASAADGQAPPAEALPSASTPGGTADDPSSGEIVVIDVTGKVRRPGIVELPLGSRVFEALKAAGGARKAADIGGLNLARVLIDGEQIVVGIATPEAGPVMTPADPADPAESGQTIAPVNINTATSQQLETLPGVGPVTAAAIIEWRAQNGAFSTVDELLEVSGIGDATLGELKPYVHV